MSSDICSLLVGEIFRKAGMVARGTFGALVGGAAITDGTANYYLKALTGTNAGKWWDNSTGDWVAEETANAMTHIRNGNWFIQLSESPFEDGILYHEHSEDEENRHIPGNGQIIRGCAVKQPATIGAGDIAPNAVDANSVKADAVAKLQLGLATSAILGTPHGASIAKDIHALRGEGEWTQTAGPIANLGFFSRVYIDGSTWHGFYSYLVDGLYAIGHSTSTNGTTFTDDAVHNPILSASNAGAYADHGCILCDAWKEGSTWHALFSGRKTAGASYTSSMLHATASDPAGPWTMDAANPVLEGTAGEWDEGQVEQSCTIKIGSTYWVYYSTIFDGFGLRKVGLASSTDLQNWTKYAGNPIFGGIWSGRFCPWVFNLDTGGKSYYMLIPHYTSAVDFSEIELWRASDQYFLDGDRELVRIVYTCQGTGWNSWDSDTPCLLCTDVTRTVMPGTAIRCYYAGVQKSTGTWATGLLYETSADRYLKMRTVPQVISPLTPIAPWQTHEQATEVAGGDTAGTLELLTRVPDADPGSAGGLPVLNGSSNLLVYSVTQPVVTSSVTDKTGYSLAATGLDAIPITAPAGVASTFREMVVQTWRRFFKKASKSTTQIKTYADNGTTVITTQTISDDGEGNETQGGSA